MVIVTAMAVGIQILFNLVTKIHIELEENVLFFFRKRNAFPLKHRPLNITHPFGVNYISFQCKLRLLLMARSHGQH